MSLVYFAKIIDILEESPEMKRTFKGIGRQMVYAASGTAIGGIVGGPVGAFTGTMIGSFIALATSDNYHSLLAVLKNLTEEEKIRLAAKVQQLIGSMSIESLVEFVQSEVNRELLLKTIGSNARGG